MIKSVTVKPLYNDNPRDPKILPVVDRGRPCSKGTYVEFKLGPPFIQVVTITGWSLPQV